MNIRYLQKASGVIRSKIILPIEARWFSRHQSKYNHNYSFTEAVANYKSRNEIHAYAHHYFSWFCPQIVKDHRCYFRQNSRGFGEDAFHAMWWILINENHPKYCLEIGVYRGQVMSLWALIAKESGFHCEIHGISPFSPIGDSVSVYRHDVDYIVDTLDSFKYFSLPEPILVKALSTDTAAIAHISGHMWDMVYIDGSHEFETVLKDYRLCLQHLRPGGLLVFDDSSLGTTFHPPIFSFAGHPGPSRVVREYAMKEMCFLGAVGHNNVFKKR